MKRKGSGNGIRYDSAHEVIERNRRQAPNAGVFLSYLKFCGVCKQNKSGLGAKQLAPGIYKCADCRGIKAAGGDAA